MLREYCNLFKNDEKQLLEKVKDNRRFKSKKTTSKRLVKKKGNAKVYHHINCVVLLFIICIVRICSSGLLHPWLLKMGEQFRLTYSLNQQVSSFNAPKFDNFNFLGGPTQSQSSSYNMVKWKNVSIV